MVLKRNDNIKKEFLAFLTSVTVSSVPIYLVCRISIILLYINKKLLLQNKVKKK